VLHELQGTFGGSILKRRSGAKHRQVYEWSVYGDSAREVASLVHPFLVEKRRQAEIVMEVNRWPARSSQRDSLYREIRRLKRIDYV
jgi:hypothetical protein